VRRNPKNTELRIFNQLKYSKNVIHSEHSQRTKERVLEEPEPEFVNV
jgi:hypothetical protein